MNQGDIVWVKRHNSIELIDLLKGKIFKKDQLNWYTIDPIKVLIGSNLKISLHPNFIFTIKDLQIHKYNFIKQIFGDFKIK